MSPAFVNNEGFDWRTWASRGRSAFAVLLSLAVLIGGGWFVYTKASEAYYAWQTEDDYIGDGEEEIEVTIPRGAGANQVADILVDADVIRSARTFLDVARSHPDYATLQPGRYTLKTKLPAEKALEMLVDPENRVVVRIQLIEGLTNGQQWANIEEQIGVSVAQFEEAAVAADLGVPEWGEGNLEGFLFPDTYQVDEPFEAGAIMKRQVEQFLSVSTELGLEGGAGDLGYTPHEVLTVASIVEREVSQEEYRSMVAAVIYNRLDEGMRLQMDSTVHYATGEYGKVTTTAEQREIDSPYNTYRYEGLPPGPISNPGQAALQAALQPADTNALFFVTVNLDTGETKFAETDEEHQANVEEFQQWCQANEGRC